MKGIFIILLIAGAGFYVFQGGSTEIRDDITVKELKDKLASETVSSEHAEVAFRNAVINMCEINGVDQKNGFGTTEQCLSRFEAASLGCFDDISGFRSKEYSDSREFEKDFSEYFHCTANQL